MELLSALDATFTDSTVWVGALSKNIQHHFFFLRTCIWRLTTALERLVEAKIQAGDRSRDHIFLNLNQVAVGVGHGQHREHVFAARDNNQLARPVVLVSLAPILILHGW